MPTKFASRVRAIASEPLVHFLFGALCVALVLGLKPQDKPLLLTMDDEQVAELVAAVEADPRVEAGSVEASGLVAAYVRDELLYQQALDNELYRNPSLKGALIREMKRELEPVITDPTDEQLRAYYAANLERYRSPPSISFEHVSWPSEVTTIPPDIDKRLNNGESPEHFGQPVRLANPVPVTYLPHLVHNFGEQAAEDLMASPVGVWVGPIQSKLGTHYVRVTRKNLSGEQPFEQVRGTLKNHWIRDQINLALEAELQAMSAEYRIEVPEAYRDTLP